MRFELMNAVILAEDYELLKNWYMDALGLTLKEEWSDKYHYAELTHEGRYVFGITPAAEMGVTPGDRKNAAVVAQFNTDDVKAFLAQVKERGGTVPFGPSHDEGGDFWFGAFADPEGNCSWVVGFPKQMKDAVDYPG